MSEITVSTLNIVALPFFSLQQGLAMEGYFWDPGFDQNTERGISVRAGNINGIRDKTATRGSGIRQ